jgi:hypothetical protein
MSPVPAARLLDKGRPSGDLGQIWSDREATVAGIRALAAVVVFAGLLVASPGGGRAADGPPPVKPPGVPLGACSVIDSVASDQQHPCPDQDPDGQDDGGDGPLGSQGA